MDSDLQYVLNFVIVVFIIILFGLFGLLIPKLLKAVEQITKAIDTITLCNKRLNDKAVKPKDKGTISDKPLTTEVKVCPICNNRVFGWECFCSNCGQRLDWGKDK